MTGEPVMGWARDQVQGDAGMVTIDESTAETNITLPVAEY
jgi:hypothetical protein